MKYIITMNSEMNNTIYIPLLSVYGIDNNQYNNFNNDDNNDISYVTFSRIIFYTIYKEKSL
jgi:hypothetical protein